jgi:hypothetical protein
MPVEPPVRRTVLPSTGKWFFLEKKPMMSKESTARNTSKAIEAQNKTKAME